MTEYIEREAVLGVLKRYSVGTWRGIPCYPDEIKSAAKDVNSIPAADVAPVVRCEDCRHFRRNLENDTYCGCVGGLTDPEEHDFCSYGERKEGDSDGAD